MLEHEVRTAQQNKRYALLDSYRGFVVLNMIAFHFLYDWYVIFGDNGTWHHQNGVHLWQQYICWSFIILSGFVWRYGKRKAWKRGLFLNVMGLVITAVTCVFIPDEAIWFGILNFIGCAMLLMIPLDKLLQKVPPLLGMVLSMLVFLLLRDIGNGNVGIGDTVFFELPDAWYQSYVLVPFGFAPKHFSSSDYFSILPWMLLYIFGYYFGKWFSDTKVFAKVQGLRIPVLDVIGRNSVWFYMAHQPVCYGICLLFQNYY